MSLRCYIASPWSHKAEAADAQKKFEAAGLIVTSRWIQRESNLTYEDLTKPEHEEELATQAILDVEDVVASDVFVILNLDKSEGKATELGMAYSLGIPIILVGDRTRNIFYFLPGIFRADTVEQAVEGIAATAAKTAASDGVWMTPDVKDGEVVN